MIKKFFSFFILFLFIICISSSNYTNNENSNFNEMIFPTNTNINNISSDYGYRQLYGKTNFHNGVDFPVVPGTPVYSTLAGTVNFSGFTSGYGICVTIIHNNGLKSLYGHLSEGYIAYLGKTVSAGEIIGYVGPKYLSDGRLNGYTTGPHLHFSLFDSAGNSKNPLDYNYSEK